MIPEISVARKHDHRGAAKIALFAYHRESRQPVWQSGITVAASDAKEVWVFGAGPIQYGTIHNETRFAGARIRDLLPGEHPDRDRPPGVVSYYESVDFEQVAKRAEERKAAAEALEQQFVEIPRLSPLSREILAAPNSPQPRPVITDPDPPAPPVAERPSPEGEVQR